MKTITMAVTGSSFFLPTLPSVERSSRRQGRPHRDHSATARLGFEHHRRRTVAERRLGTRRRAADAAAEPYVVQAHVGRNRSIETITININLCNKGDDPWARLRPKTARRSI